MWNDRSMFIFDRSEPLDDQRFGRFEKFSKKWFLKNHANSTVYRKSIGSAWVFTHKHKTRREDMCDKNQADMCSFAWDLVSQTSKMPTKYKNDIFLRIKRVLIQKMLNDRSTFVYWSARAVGWPENWSFLKKCKKMIF